MVRNEGWLVSEHSSPISQSSPEPSDRHSALSESYGMSLRSCPSYVVTEQDGVLGPQVVVVLEVGTW